MDVNIVHPARLHTRQEHATFILVFIQEHCLAFNLSYHNPQCNRIDEVRPGLMK